MAYYGHRKNNGSGKFLVGKILDEEQLTLNFKFIKQLLLNFKNYAVSSRI